MLQTAWSKYILIGYTFLWIPSFLVACQSSTIATQNLNNELLGNENTLQTSSTDISESPPTLEIVSTPTPLPAFTVTPMSTPFSQETTVFPTSEPTRTSFYGWLLFSSQRQDTNKDGTIDGKDGVNLYNLNVTTGQMSQLTFGHERNLYPTWSPDRSQIAFVSNRDGNYELYVMNADGSEIKRLTNTLENEMEPSWAPDGTRIVYVLVKTLNSGLQEKRLHLITPLDNDLQQITSGPGNDEYPSWSPDGRYIIFSRVEDSLGTIVYLLEPESDTLYKLSPSVRESGCCEFSEPQWLPQNGYFLSMTQIPGDQSSAGIKVFELEWEEGHPVLHRIYAVNDVYGRYIWGPNGEWIISINSNDKYYGTISDEALNDLVLLPIDFSTQRPALTTNLTEKSRYGYSLYDGELITDDTFYDDYPDWAP